MARHIYYHLDTSFGFSTISKLINWSDPPFPELLEDHHLYKIQYIKRKRGKKIKIGGIYFLMIFHFFTEVSKKDFFTWFVPWFLHDVRTACLKRVKLLPTRVPIRWTKVNVILAQVALRETLCLFKCCVNEHIITGFEIGTSAETPTIKIWLAEHYQGWRTQLLETPKPAETKN